MSDFQGAGQKPGLQVWRIEKLVPKLWEDHGKFCSGDSYIVLKTNARPGSSALEWDLHFWLGAETSQDEAGVAALKTVELDDLLGGAPVQHREVQGHESDKFLSYFKGGVQYIQGGVESGFTKVVRDQYEPRLLQCKGAKTVRVTQVPVSAQSLNSGDVFVLDLGLTIYQWNGKDANKKEKAKALDVTGSIKNNERGGRAQVIVFDEGNESAEFWSALGGKAAIAPGKGDSDAQAEQKSQENLVLYRVSDSGFSVAGKYPLKKDLLDSNDAFILDTGSDIFAWIGKGASNDERKNAIIKAQAFLTEHGKPAHTKVTRVVEGSETALFKDNFSDWTDLRPPTKHVAASNVAKSQAQADIDVSSLLSALPHPTDTPVDDGSGKIQIWRINNFQKEPIPEDIYGHFYAGDSYIVLYTYKQGTKEKYIIYFWQGRNSSADEKGAAALLTTKLDDELHGAATQVRVVQGKEPVHFLSLFKGHLVIHSGGTASGFKNRADLDSYDIDGVSLYHVKGTNAVNTHAVQVAEKASSLNSGDVFLLDTPQTLFLWLGSGSNADEHEVARKLANNLKSSTVTEVTEGQESEEFWSFLGGKTEYAQTRDLVHAPREPRLFHVSNATGVVKAEEIFDYSQDDLDDSDVYILDIWTEVFVWLGSQSNPEEKNQASTIGTQFVEKSGRADVPVVAVYAGHEPSMFTAAFLGWDHEKAQAFEDPYTKKLRLLEAAKAEKSADAAPASSEPADSQPAAGGSYLDPVTTTFTYEELKNKTAAGVNPVIREQYLSDEEFEKVLKMNKAKFAELKDWKKAELRKQTGLW